MVDLPPKAFKESQLTFQTAGSASPINEGSHETYKVKLNDNGVTRSAFYKKIAPKKHYPELLAKISVATSLLKRMFQGSRSAEERLVFDEKGNLTGTLSFTLDNFRPFNFAGEPVPSEPQSKEAVVPSTDTLIEHDSINLLFGRWFLDDDDSHPHNLSLAGDIDFDMFFYWFTIDMKEPRPVIGTPKTKINLTVEDWERFPNVEDSKVYHWPTYTHPGQKTIANLVPGQGQGLRQTLPKGYADPEAFKALAANPKAQEQKFAAALAALLTYQPELFKKKLKDRFGDLTLNYSALDESLRKKYEDKFPALCNAKTDKASFVDFMMTLYQMHYDNLYRVVVFYKGCENNGYSLSLLPTHESLRTKPSYFKNIKNWVEQQNASMAEDDSRFSLDELYNRYHQIWRDSFAPTFIGLLHRSYALTKHVVLEVTRLSSLPEVLPVDPYASTVTEVHHLFGTVPKLEKNTLERLICVDKNSSFREGLLLLVDFTNEFYQIVTTYYSKKREELKQQDNLDFTTGLRILHTRYRLDIQVKLANTSSDAQDFLLIADALNGLIETSNFIQHLATNDEQMQRSAAQNLSRQLLPYTNPELQKDFNTNLFKWVKALNAMQFENYVKEAIETFYKTSLTGSTRTRDGSVLEFLQKSRSEPNDLRLAYILGSAETETGALNRALIKYLAPIMIRNPGYTIYSIEDLINKDKFHAEVVNAFTLSIVAYSKETPQLAHLCSNKGIELVFDEIYAWIENQSDQVVKSLIANSLTKYEQGISFLTTSRRAEVIAICKKYTSKAKMTGFIFLAGGTEPNSYNAHLFNSIVDAMQKDAQLDLLKPGCKLIKQYNREVNQTIYLSHLKEHAKAITSIQERKPEATGAATVVSSSPSIYARSNSSTFFSGMNSPLQGGRTYSAPSSFDNVQNN